MTAVSDLRALAEKTPWGESFDDLAEAILNDKAAPPILLIAAFLYTRGEQTRLRTLIADAVALNEAEAAP